MHVTGGGCFGNGEQVNVNMWMIMYGAITEMYVTGALLLYSLVAVQAVVQCWGILECCWWWLCKCHGILQDL